MVDSGFLGSGSKSTPGPATRPIGEFRVDLPRPRDVAEVRTDARFVELHRQIWAVLRDEVLKGYQQQLQKAA